MIIREWRGWWAKLTSVARVPPDIYKHMCIFIVAARPIKRFRIATPYGRKRPNSCPVEDAVSGWLQKETGISNLLRCAATPPFPPLPCQTVQWRAQNHEPARDVRGRARDLPPLSLRTSMHLIITFFEGVNPPFPPSSRKAHLVWSHSRRSQSRNRRGRISRSRWRSARRGPPAVPARLSRAGSLISPFLMVCHSAWFECRWAAVAGRPPRSSGNSSRRQV